MQAIKIDLKKIDQFGNTQVIYQSVSKEDRERGIKGATVSTLAARLPANHPESPHQHEPHPQPLNLLLKTQSLFRL